MLEQQSALDAAHTSRAITNLNRYLDTPEEQILREHQFDAMGAIRDFLASGEKNGYIALPPGAGKTIIYSQLARGTGLRALVLSPTVKILSQANETFEVYAPDIAVSSYYGRRKDLTGDVVNTTYQSALRLLESGKLDPKSFDLVVLDELHTALGEQRHKIHQYFDHAIRLSLTATPSFDQLEGYEQRGLISQDEQWLGVFRNCIYEMGLEEAMERGILANADIIMFKTRTRVQDVEIASTGDYSKRDINRELNKEARNYLTIGMIAGADKVPSHIRISADKRAEIEQIHEKIKGRRTAVFGLSVDQVNELAARLQNLGISAAAVHGEVPYDERDRIFAQHKQGKIQVVLGVDMLRIGWDSPETKVGIYQAPTHSGTVALQEFGRILRPYEDQNALAIQFVDEFEQRRNAPVLIPNLFDPEYVLRGTSSGLGVRRNGESGREKVPVVFSGMEIESIIEEARSNELLRTRFKRGSIDEIAEIIDRLIEETQEQNPDLVGLSLYREIQKAIPRTPREKQLEAFQGIASIDSNIVAKSKKVLLFTALGTIMSAIEPFLTRRDDRENEEILHAALQGVMDSLSNLKTGTHIGGSIYSFAERGVFDLLKDKYGIPQAWVRKDEYTRELGLLISLFRNPKGLSPENVSEIATLLVERFGINRRQIREYLTVYNEQIILAKNSPDEFVEAQGDALRKVMEDLLSGLKPREKKVIEMRYGFEDGRERTLEEIGNYFDVTRERSRQIEARVLRHLRHPSRSKQLRDFLDRDDEVQRPIRYDSRDFTDSRTQDEVPVPRLTVNGRPILSSGRRTTVRVRRASTPQSELEAAWEGVATEKPTLREKTLAEQIMSKSRKGKYIDIDTLEAILNDLREKRQFDGREVGWQERDDAFTTLYPYRNELRENGDQSILHVDMPADLVRHLKIVKDWSGVPDAMTIEGAKRIINLMKQGRWSSRYLSIENAARIDRAIQEFEEGVFEDEELGPVARALLEALKETRQWDDQELQDAAAQVTHPSWEKPAEPLKITDSNVEKKPKPKAVLQAAREASKEGAVIGLEKLRNVIQELETSNSIGDIHYTSQAATDWWNMGQLKSWVNEIETYGNDSIVHLDLPGLETRDLVEKPKSHPGSLAEQARTISGAKRLLERPIEEYWYTSSFTGAEGKRLKEAIEKFEQAREQEEIQRQLAGTDVGSKNDIISNILTLTRRGKFLDVEVLDSYADQLLIVADISKSRAQRAVERLDEYIAAIDEHRENSVAHLAIEPSAFTALLQLSKARPELNVMTISGLKTALGALDSGNVNFRIAGGNKRINELKNAIAEFDRTK